MSMKTKLTVTCCLCSETHTKETEIPQGWKVMHDVIYHESGFCSSHSSVAEFVDSQCHGCAGGWMDCHLWRDFGYNKRGLNDSELAEIRGGSCPRRVNGTFAIDSSGVSDVDLSEKASTPSGEALAQAILDFWELYGVEADQAGP